MHEFVIMNLIFKSFHQESINWIQCNGQSKHSNHMLSQHGQEQILLFQPTDGIFSSHKRYSSSIWSNHLKSILQYQHIIKFMGFLILMQHRYQFQELKFVYMTFLQSMNCGLIKTPKLSTLVVLWTIIEMLSAGSQVQMRFAHLILLNIFLMIVKCRNQQIPKN